MTDQKEPVEHKVALGEPRTSAPRITRRRFTKAGLAAPLVMTLGSRPVWGQTCSFSGQLSGNDYTTSAPAGAGNPPSYYWNGGDEGNLPGDVKFSTQVKNILKNQLGHDDTCGFFGNNSVGDLLQMGDDDVGAQATAAVLNILNGGYGYGADGLTEFICISAMAHPVEALSVLQCLNSQDRTFRS
jgi:hypothetical protein